jgi:hypothetical protein
MTSSERPRELVTAALPAVRGCPDLVQGAYGDHGNLELVAPGPEPGFWVFWWNADSVERHSGVAVGAWSPGLWVPGEAADRVRIAQMRAGPLFLEALVAGPSGLHRYCWTPDAGFVRRGQLLDQVCDVSRMVETDEAAHVLVTRPDGQTSHLSADLSTYPDLSWRAGPGPTVAGEDATVCLARRGAGLATVVSSAGSAQLFGWDGQWATEADIAGRWSSAELKAGAVIGRHPDGSVQCAVLDADGARDPVTLWPDRQWTSLAVADTTLRGGRRVDLVLGRGDTLWHAFGTPAGPWSEPEPIRSAVWTPAPA